MAFPHANLAVSTRSNAVAWQLAYYCHQSTLVSSDLERHYSVIQAYN